MLKRLFNIMKNVRLFAYACPACCNMTSPQGEYDLFASCLYKRVGKKYKYYIKCRDCNRETPLFDTRQEAEECWLDMTALYLFQNQDKLYNENYEIELLKEAQ